MAKLGELGRWQLGRVRGSQFLANLPCPQQDRLAKHARPGGRL